MNNDQYENRFDDELPSGESYASNNNSGYEDIENRPSSGDNHYSEQRRGASSDNYRARGGSRSGSGRPNSGSYDRNASNERRQDDRRGGSYDRRDDRRYDDRRGGSYERRDDRRYDDRRGGDDRRSDDRRYDDRRGGGYDRRPDDRRYDDRRGGDDRRSDDRRYDDRRGGYDRRPDDRRYDDRRGGDDRRSDDRRYDDRRGGGYDRRDDRRYDDRRGGGGYDRRDDRRYDDRRDDRRYDDRRGGGYDRRPDDRRYDDRRTQYRETGGRRYYRDDRSSSRERNDRYQQEKRTPPQRPTTLIKALVRLHYASRQFTLDAIKNNHVTINDVLANKPNMAVKILQDIVKVDDVFMMHNPRNVYIVMNKPRKFAGAPEDDSRHIFSLLSKKHGWYVPCGPLAKSASGIVVLTNDPEQRHPVSNLFALMEKEYWFKVNKVVTKKDLSGIESKVQLLHQDNIGQVVVDIGQINKRNSWVKVVLKSGRVTDLCSILNSSGLQILAIERKRLGSLSVDELPSGSWRRLTDEDIQSLITNSVSEKQLHSLQDSVESNASVWYRLYQRWFKPE
jgi:pseudouridine synthase